MKIEMDKYYALTKQDLVIGLVAIPVLGNKIAMNEFAIKLIRQEKNNWKYTYITEQKQIFDITTEHLLKYYVKEKSITIKI